VGAVIFAQDATEARRTQADLLAAQRLASVGTLAAGIAHEINTPVQFVSDSIIFLRSAVGDLFAFLGKLQRLQRAVLEGAPTGAVVAECTAAEEDADLPYIRENVPGAFDRCVDGLGRVATIVRSLKEFAHPSGKEMSAVDLNRAIQSTLTIARNEYKYVAELDVELGEIPSVICHGDEINQVILNILVNAAHAIEEVVRGSDRKGRIWVRTEQQGDSVLISIGDTGGGIPPHVLGRIFDPFFTTKEVGKGTGQGLAIARTIVRENHHGEIAVETTVGEGTTFRVRLPIAPLA
jgi:two-component system NtrC family sensor kinase